MRIRENAGAGETAPAGFRGLRRALVHDSTVIKLPAGLFEIFSGVANAHSAVCNARIQAAYDLVCGRLVSFSIDPYSKNDLSAAPELELMEGDLVLRDRGYLTAAEMQRHRDAGASFIYRHKTGMTYLDPLTLRPVDLAALLRERGTLDMEVLFNNRERTPVRLLAAPVSKETADLRRMRAKKETKGHNPSAAMLELMDWTVFLTDIPAALAMYRTFERRLWRKHSRRLSLLKFVKYIAARPERLRRAIDSATGATADTDKLDKALVKYCCYDKRKKRLNFNEMWESLA